MIKVRIKSNITGKSIEKSIFNFNNYNKNYEVKESDGVIRDVSSSQSVKVITAKSIPSNGIITDTQNNDIKYKKVKVTINNTDHSNNKNLSDIMNNEFIPNQENISNNEILNEIDNYYESEVNFVDNNFEDEENDNEDLSNMF